jgi:hypothetical protein
MICLTIKHVIYNIISKESDEKESTVSFPFFFFFFYFMKKMLSFFELLIYKFSIENESTHFPILLLYILY